MDLATKLTQPFSKLTFEEKKHRYSVEDKPINISVSGLISKFYEHFNAKAVAPYSAIKLGVTTEEVLKQWADIEDTEYITLENFINLTGVLNLPVLKKKL